MTKVVDVPKEQIKAQGAVVLDNLVILDNPEFLGQRKFNGMKVFIVKAGKKIYIVSGRSWKQSYQHREFLQPAIQELQMNPNDFIAEAEGTFFVRGTPREPDPLVTMNGTDENLSNYDFRLIVHTLLELNGKSLRHVKYGHNLIILTTVFLGGGQVEPIHSYFGADKRKAWEKHKSLGWEGMMFKRIDGPSYEDGRDSRNNLKLKQMYLDEHGNHEQDCIVIGLTKGKGKNEPTFGALLLAQYVPTYGMDLGRHINKENIGIGYNLKYVGKCSGMTDSMRQEIYEMSQKKSSWQPPYMMPADLQEQLKDAKVSQTELQMYWRDGPVVQVHYLKKNPSGIYLSAQFDRIRDDKPQEECIQK